MPRLRFFVCLAGFSLALGCKPPTKENGGESMAWVVTQPKWDLTADTEFGAWVEKIGEARASEKCKKLSECILNESANSLFKSEDRKIDFLSSPQIFPHSLRSYFAYRTKRPFAIAAVTQPAGSEGSITAGRELDRSSFQYFEGFFRTIKDNVAQNSYRTKAEDQNSDTYPIDINRKTVRAGTLYTDSDGQTYVVYKVATDGTIRLLGYGANGVLSVQRFGEKFGRGSKILGAGFRNWRPYTQEKDGKIVRLPNFAQSDYSADAQNQEEYPEGNYHKWVKKRLFGGGQERSVVEFEDRVSQICADVGERVASVDAATAHGIHMMPHPEQLPENVFNAEGDWGLYSTATRDAKLRSSIREAYSFVIETLAIFQGGSRQYDFDGISSKRELVAQYLTVWRKLLASSSCRYSYKSSTGVLRSIDVNYVVTKIFDLSFDPYHCSELRWGVQTGQPEFNATVCSKEDSLSWYEKEKTFRNTFDVDMHGPTPIGWGTSDSREVNIGLLLERLSGSLAEK